MNSLSNKQKIIICDENVRWEVVLSWRGEPTDDAPKALDLVAADGVDVTCSRCGRKKPLLTGFGMRRMPNGDLRNQPQCRLCRSARPAPPLVRLRIPAVQPLPRRLILNWLTTQRRHRREISLDRIERGARVSPGEALEFARWIEREGAGRFIKGSRGHQSRIRWSVPVGDMVAKRERGAS